MGATTLLVVLSICQLSSASGRQATIDPVDGAGIDEVGLIFCTDEDDLLCACCTVQDVSELTRSTQDVRLALQPTYVTN